MRKRDAERAEADRAWSIRNVEWALEEAFALDWFTAGHYAGWALTHSAFVSAAYGLGEE